MDSLNWMEDCISSLTDGDFSLFVVTCWALWNNQNNHMHSNLIRSPAEIVEFSRQYVQNFVDAIFHQVLDNVLPLPTVISRKWSSPPMSWIKMNFDGACFKEEGAVGLGVVARNRNGCFLEGHSLMIGANLDVEASEAMGALDALRLVRQLGYSRVIIEGDSGNIISAIEFGGYDLEHRKYHYRSTLNCYRLAWSDVLLGQERRELCCLFIGSPIPCYSLLHCLVQCCIEFH